MIKDSKKIADLVDQWRYEKHLMDQIKVRQLLWASAEKGNVAAQRILYEAKQDRAQREEAIKREREQLEDEATFFINLADNIVPMTKRTNSRFGNIGKKASGIRAKGPKRGQEGKS